jgi:hypothetical protein
MSVRCRGIRAGIPEESHLARSTSRCGLSVKNLKRPQRNAVWALVQVATCSWRQTTMRKLLNITKDKLRSSSRSRSSASNATPTLPSVNISAGTSASAQSSNLVSAPAPVPPLPAVAATKPDRTGRNIAVFRTVLSVVEKALDGLPIYGPKAVVTAVGEVLKNIQVHPRILRSLAWVAEHKCSLSLTTMLPFAILRTSATSSVRDLNLRAKIQVQ